MAKKNQLSRRARHIDGGREAFIPQRRMREIRYDEAVLRSVAKRGNRADVTFRHVHFHCPQGCCLGTPLVQE